MPLLNIQNLSVSIEGKKIIDELSLSIESATVQALMGPNGSGKSSLAQVLMGHPAYKVEEGTVKFAGQDLLVLPPEKRAQAGLFLAFQYPYVVPGLPVEYFLRTAYMAQNVARGEKIISVKDFRTLLEQEIIKLNLDAGFLNRAVNDGFSGGEKKRLEILQLAVLKPRLAILDETDSGLDVDALKIVARGVNALQKKGLTVLIITHYQKLLQYIAPQNVNIMVNGKITHYGGMELVEKIEKLGYQIFEPSHA